MSKVKLTKGELKRQRDALVQFRHYLPTLQLKKQQLQLNIQQKKALLSDKTVALETMEQEIEIWIGLLADPGIDLAEWIIPKEVLLETVNIAGANIPQVKDIVFKQADYGYYETPFWIDQGIEELRELVSLLIEINVLRKQIEVLHHELRVTTQRVNLFEKVKIPQCIENIRVIRIYLGDQQANAVGISKVAKKKIERMKALAGVLS